MKPYEALPDRIEYEGETYALDLSYATFFAVADLLSDDRLMYGQKLATALDMFIPGEHPEDPELLNLIFELVKSDRPKTDGPNYIDIEQDWPYICAGFEQAYGIDLWNDKSIHITRWQALLQSLPSDTKIMEIVRIRATPLPEPTKYNGQQIAELSRLKAQYAIRGKGKDFQHGLASLFDLLQNTAAAR